MTRLLLVTALSLFGQGVWAQTAGVPLCWSEDQPKVSIHYGLFRVLVATNGQSATAIAEVLGILSQSLAGQVAVGTSNSLDQIEIDMYGELKYWRPTVSFPTIESYKSAIRATLAPVLSLPGVRIECARVVPHSPVH